MTENRLKPRTFRLDDPNVVMSTDGTLPVATPRGSVVITPTDDPVGEDAGAEPVSRRRRSRWGALLWSALGGLVSLALGLSVSRLIEDLFARADWLGWLGAALAALAALALVVIALREAFALMRLSRIEAMHDRAQAAIAADDRPAARALVADLLRLYAAEPRTARARRAVEEAAGDIVDGADLVRIAERELMGPLDQEARRIITDAATRVSVVTAMSPRALVDILFVGAETIRLIRRLATLYGGRPGALGLTRLIRHALGNLAITGGMAAGDSILGQVMGHGFASKISAKLGEGVLNGILISRLGLAAMSVTRPLPFNALQRPGITDVAGGLFSKEKPKEEARRPEQE